MSTSQGNGNRSDVGGMADGVLSTRSIRYSGPSPISRSTHARSSIRSPRSQSHAATPVHPTTPTENRGRICHVSHRTT